MLVLFAVVFAIRAVLALLLPPVADEAYYMLWANHLSLAYVDHPGMVAWLLAGINGMVPNPLLAARLLSAVLYALTTIVIYDTVRLYGKQRWVAMMAGLAVMLVPYHFVVGITYQVEQPLILGSALAIWSWVRWVKYQKNRYGYALAISLVMVVNTKLTGGLLALGFLMVIGGVSSRWHWLKNKHFWGAILVFIAGMIPFLVWQSMHDWVSFAFHANRVGETQWFAHFFEFLGNQVLYLSPVLIAWIGVAWRSKPKSELWRDMIVLSGAIWIPFALLSIKTQVYPHWPIIATLPAIVAISTVERLNNQRWIGAMAGFTAVVVLVLVAIQPSYLHSEVRHNRDVIAQIKETVGNKQGEVKVLSDFHGSVGILSVLTGYSVGMTQVINEPGSRWGDIQIGQWQNSDIPQNGAALLWIDTSPETVKWLKERFQQVSVMPERLSVLEPHISKKRLIWCTGAYRLTRI